MIFSDWTARQNRNQKFLGCQLKEVISCVELHVHPAELSSDAPFCVFCAVVCMRYYGLSKRSNPSGGWMGSSACCEACYQTRVYECNTGTLLMEPNKRREWDYEHSSYQVVSDLMVLERHWHVKDLDDANVR